MGSIDYDSPRAELYISQVREIERGGGTLRTRPAVSAGERTMAREIRRRVDRLTFGYAAGGEAKGTGARAHKPGARVCEVCGARRGLRVAGHIWVRGGGIVPRYRCKGGC